MPLGTIDRTPPPFFRQGLSALTKLALCSALALFLMAADRRLALLEPARAAVATLLLPAQSALAVPVQGLRSAGSYVQGLQAAIEAEQALHLRLTEQAERVTQVERLSAENARLRALLELRENVSVRNSAAQVLYEAADPYSRKVVIDRGGNQGLVIASPVINEQGVLGQVTRLYPLTAEVTLLSDKDAAIPVLNSRTQQRSAAFGAGAGTLELRYMAGNADVQVGDLLTTSGVDGVYPPGLPVARVAAVERRADAGFARVLLSPVAAPDAVRHVLVLQPLAMQMPARPQPEVQASPERAPRGKGRR